MKAGYQFKGRHEKVNHLLYMDDLKLYGKDEAQIDSLVKSEYIRLVRILEWNLGLQSAVSLY